MQHVSVNNWPEAARFNTKNHAWTPFRAFPRLFRKFPRLFREFPLLFLAPLCMSNSPTDTAAKPCQRLLKAFNYPINSRWAQATMPQYMILCCDISWSSDPCGNLVTTILSHQIFFVALLHDGPEGQTSNALPCVLWKKVCVSENVSKNVLVWKNIVFQPNTFFCIHMAASVDKLF